MYFLKNNRYKIISKILFFVLVIEPVLMVPFAKPVFAQSNSNGFNQAYSNYDGISQWGNLDIINNPAIGNALKSCLQVVPSFTKKITKVFGSNSAANSSAILNSGRTAELKSFCSNDTSAKWATGSANGYGNELDGYVSDADLSRCQDIADDTLGVVDNIERFSDSSYDVIQTEDKQASKKLDKVLNEQKRLQSELSQTKQQVSETNSTLSQNKIRNECMDSIAYSMTKTLLAGVTEGTVNLINTGNFGDPFFVKDTKSYFEDLNKLSLKQVFGGVLDAAQQDANQYPFLRATYRNLVEQNVPAPFQNRARFTLEQILSNQPYNKNTDPTVSTDQIATGQGSFTRAFKNDFSVGGWQGWLALTQLPQNNPIGFAIIAQEELSRSQTVAKEQAKSELEQSGGFLSMRKCVEQRVPAVTQGVGIEKIATGEYTIKTRGIKIAPDHYDCVKSEVVTPGSVLASRLNAVITSDVRQLELADQFNESLNLIFTSAFNKLTSEGLTALSNKVYGSWADNTRKQSFIERYNSTLNVSNNSSSSIQTGTRELIYRRVTSSYSSSDFDITTDLFDQQVGCTIRPGILNTEKNYLFELQRSNNKNISPLYKLMPAMAELDFCIPGPTTNWEELADENLDDLVSQITEHGIGFQTEPQLAGSFYSDIGKQIGDIQKKQLQGDNIQKGVVVGLRSAGVITAVLPFPPFAQIIGAAIIALAEIGNLVTNLARAKKKKENEKHINMLNRAESALPSAIEYAWEKEGNEWAIKQLNYLQQDYNDYKVAVYDKFKDENNIPVASLARPFIKDLPSYAQNLFTVQESYNEEIDNQQKIVSELQKIHDRVKDIKDVALAEAKRRNLPTDVPVECKPQPQQCPALGPGNRYLLNGNAQVYDKLGPNSSYAVNGTVLATTYSRTSSFAPVGVASSQNQGTFYNGSAEYKFADPEVNIVSFSVINSPTGAQFTGNLYTLYLSLNTNPETLSVILDMPFAGISNKEIYGQSSVVEKVLLNQSPAGQTIKVTATNANNKKKTISCTIKQEGNYQFSCN